MSVHKGGAHWPNAPQPPNSTTSAPAHWHVIGFKSSSSASATKPASAALFPFENAFFSPTTCASSSACGHKISSTSEPLKQQQCASATKPASAALFPLKLHPISENASFLPQPVPVPAHVDTRSLQLLSLLRRGGGAATPHWKEIWFNGDVNDARPRGAGTTSSWGASPLSHNFFKGAKTTTAATQHLLLSLSAFS